MGGLVLKVTPSRPFYRAGDILSATVQVYNQPDSSANASVADLVGITIECWGVERVDPAWVSSSYGEGQPVLRKDGRKIIRQVFRAHQSKILSAVVLSPGQHKQFEIRVRLPEQLPPSFNGTAARYAYFIEAMVTYYVRPLSLAPLTLRDSEPEPSTSTPPRPSSQGALVTTGSNGALGDEQFFAAQQSSVLTACFQPRRPGTFAVVPTAVGIQQRRTRTTFAVWPVKVELWDRSPSAAGPMRPEGADVPTINYKLGTKVEDIKIVTLAAETSESVVPSPQVSRRPSTQPNEPTTPSFPPHQLRLVLPNRSQPHRASSNWGGDPFDMLEEGEDEGDDTRSVAPSMSMRSAYTPRERFLTPSFTSEESNIKVYNLRMGDQPLAVVSVHPPVEGSFMPGTMVAGTIDFRLAQQALARDELAPKCVEVLVMLETEEVVAEKYQLPRRNAIRKLYQEHHELTPDTDLMHYIFTVPTTGPMSFNSNLVRVRWVLRFEFTVLYTVTQVGWTGSSQLQSKERIVWSTPVVVKPPA